MPPASRPVKLACLPCQASKIRCNGQNPCSNCISHGGARRGPAAADELAKKRAQRLAGKPAVDNLLEEPELLGQLYHHHSQGSASTPNAPLPMSPAESGLQPSSVLGENCSVGNFSPLGGAAPGLLGAVDLPARALRAYGCPQDLINAYYIFIHLYLPLLPPPVVDQYEDKCVGLEVRSTYASASVLPYWPISPLGLALAEILTLIPLPGDPRTSDEGAAALRRSYADLYARSAMESLEESLEPSSHTNLAAGPRCTLHHAILQKMEPCCQRGNVSKMRLRANQALTGAIDLSLHTETPQTGCLDAHRRCWWAVMFLVYQSSIMTASHSLITFDDIRITTMFPEFRGCREPWPLLVKAQAALLRSCCIGRELTREPRTVQNRSSFLGAPLDFLALDASRTSSGPVEDFHLPTSQTGQVNSHFPFTQQESIRICLHSSLVVSRVFRRLPSPNPSYSDTTVDVTAAVSRTSRRPLSSPRSVPYMASCQLQSF
ncbi:hypothetical protein BDV11DRAFT_211359 [Aspergillus similis]